MQEKYSYVWFLRNQASELCNNMEKEKQALFSSDFQFKALLSFCLLPYNEEDKKKARLWIENKVQDFLVTNQWFLRNQTLELCNNMMKKKQALYWSDKEDEKKARL